MKSCLQTEGQTILQHGLSIWKYTHKLLKKDYSNFKLPKWWNDYESRIHSNLHDFKTVKHYTINHDIGKPYCLSIDENGKRHFTDHAIKSKDVWNLIFPEKKDIGILIENDMLFHSGDELTIIKKRLPTKTICTLILTALAELHSNANMFGGITSDSFKIKFKKFEKLSKKILHYYFDHRHSYVIVRNDLSGPQKAVQSAHASIEMARAYLNKNSEHPSLVLTIVKNEPKLKEMMKELFEKDIRFIVFREPDIGNQITAIATEPLNFDKRQKLSRLQLLQ